MRKKVYPGFITNRLLLSIVAVVLSTNSLLAQCGLSSYQEPAGTFNATNSWQSLQMGSGTYADFNVASGNIYSFRYNGSPVLNYWDMTFSTTSTAIVYDNSLTPVRDPWTGGNCPNTTRPGSLEWYSTFSGTVRINTKTWDGANCLDYVPGQGSATLEYKVCTPAADPGAGNNVWNVDAYATTNINIPNTAARYGYYVDNNLNFITGANWNASTNPSTAAGWNGCEMPNDNFTVRARRTGFPCGLYAVSDNAHDDNIQIFVNGSSIYSAGCCTAAGVVGDPNGYVLGSGDNVEVRLVDVCASANANVGINTLQLPPIIPGTIGGIANGTNICQGNAVGLLTNITSASGGTTGFTNGGSISYVWEVSFDGGNTFITTPNTGTSWNVTDTVPTGGTYVFRRRATDRCGNTDISNTVTVYGQPRPNASMSPVSQYVCPGGTAVLTLNFNTGTGPFNFSFTDGVTTYSRTGKNNGDTIQVDPSVNTNYSFTYIQDSYGCDRSGGFTGGALVQIATQIGITSVAINDVSCNGGANGSITVTATGGYQVLSYSIDGGITYQASNYFGSLAANSYNVVVKDNLGCTLAYSNNPVLIGQPNPLAHTTTHTDASCANVFDGTISISATGGSQPYSYSLNGGPTQPGSTFNGLQAGTYLVTVYDNHGCSDTSSVTLGNSYIISVTTVNQTDVSCYGAADGSVTAQVNGGIPPYEYSINGVTFQSSATFSGLGAGNYIVIGRDSKGCTEFDNVTIVQPAQLTITIDSIANVLCNGSSTGAIYVTVSGGTPSYTYTWSNNISTEDNIGVTAGTYNMTVTDSKGCTTSTGATLIQPFALSLNVAQYNNPLCNGTSTGAIDITANGGVPPYAYAWSTSAITEDVVNLPAGSYTVTVTDANGCTISLTQDLTEPSAIATSITGTDVSCYGSSDGAADLTVSGGTMPYYYQWSTFQATQDISGLSSGGLYYVVVTDANGCQKRDSISINEPAPLVLSATFTNISCFNANDGTIDLTVTGGTSGYTYSWSNSANTQDISGLAGGTYVVTVTDAHNCTATLSISINNPAPINASFVIKDELCFGDSIGAVYLTPTGGTGAYSFTWSNGPSTQNDINVPSGTYYVTVTDANGCILVDSATVGSPSVLYTSGVVKNVTCHGYGDGAVNITAYGGTLPYSYLWSDSSSTQNIYGKAGNDYYVTVTDGNNCHVVSLYHVKEPAALIANMAGGNISCFGSCNGSAAIIPNGGTTPYEYLWNNFNTDSSLTALCAGHYVVQLTDSNGCHLYDSIDIAQPLEMVIADSITNVLCNGFITGAVNITVSGGTPNYTFAWSTGATTQNISGLTAGTYSVTVTDANGCVKTATFEVKESQGIFTTASISNPSCFGSSNGFVQVSVVGGTIPYNYYWSTSPSQIGATATNLNAGVYSLTVTDANNCSSTLTATLTNPDPIVVTTTSNDSKCSNTATGSVTASVTGGVPPYVYELNGILQSSNTFSNLLPGNYVLLVRDANGCEGTKSFVISSPPVLNVHLEPAQQVILEGMSTQMNATTNSSLPIIHYIWSPGLDSNFNFINCTDSTDCSNPYVHPKYTTTFTVTVMNSDSCYASDTATVYVKAEPSAFIPSVFTPNGDNLNDRFEFDILGATSIEISIFNRWGERVYYNAAQANGMNGHNGWDGKVNGKDAPYDTYVYQMKVTYFDNSTQDRSGTVTILK